MCEDKKKLEVVSGDGSNLEISPVYEHLNAGKPKTAEDKPKNIVIPKVNPSDKKKEEANENDDDIDTDNAGNNSEHDS